MMKIGTYKYGRITNIALLTSHFPQWWSLAMEFRERLRQKKQGFSHSFANFSKLARSTHLKIYTIGKRGVIAFQRCMISSWNIFFQIIPLAIIGAERMKKSLAPGINGSKLDLERILS